MKKPLILAAILAGVFSSWIYAASDDTPGIKFNDGKVVLTPVVNVGAFWESNTHNEIDDEDSGAGWRVQPALQLDVKGNNATLAARGFYTLERGFDGDDGMDSDSYGEDVRLTFGLGQKVNIELRQFYTRSENDQFYGNNGLGVAMIDTTKQENLSISGALSYQFSERFSATLGLGYNKTRYLDIDGVDTDSMSAQLMLARKISEKTDLLGAAVMGISDGESARSSETYSLMAGIGSRATENITYRALVGVSFFAFDGGTGNDDTLCRPSYSLSGAWKLSEVLALSALADSRYMNSYRGSGYQATTALWVNSFSLALNIQATKALSFRLDASYKNEDGESDVAGVRDYTHSYTALAARAFFRFNQYTSLYAGVSHNIDDYSDMADSRDNTRLDVGLQFRW